jgi:ADP-heptose:LPS heptosyltransferase
MNSNNGMNNIMIQPPSKLELSEFGIPENNIKIVDTVEEIRNNTPNIVIAECLNDVAFIQNNFKLQKMAKKNQYCMSLGVYTQLKFDIKRNIKILRPGKYKFKNIYKPYSGQDLNNKNLLIFRTGGIGDLLFINPIIRYIKEVYPTCKISLACGPQYQPMVETFEGIDKLYDLPFNASILFDNHYHAIFEGVIERTRESEKTNAYMLFSKSLGLDIPVEKLIPHQKPKQDKVDECKKILEMWKILDKPFVLLQPRASSPIRTPRFDFWEKVIDKIVDLDYNVILTDSPHQKDKLDKFIFGLKNRNRVYNFCGHSKSLDYTIALTSMSNLVIATDSALIHIGASLKKKVFGVYGPFPGHIRMSTYPNCDWIEPKDYKCCPCFQHGHLPCQYSKNGYPTCYDQIDMNECYSKIKKLIEI